MTANARFDDAFYCYRWERVELESYKITLVYIKGSDSFYILNLLSPFLTGHKACSFANHYVDVSCTFT